ncbi:MAG: OmpH/Skp family outer membrane protein [Pirellulales bacterium]
MNNRSVLSFVLTACAGSLVITGLLATNAGAQQAANPGIAIIDVHYIFANHLRFKAMMDDLGKVDQAAAADMKTQQDSFQKLAQSLKDYRKGTEEYKQLEEKLTNMQASLKAKVSLKQKELMQQEAKIYYTVYQEVVDEVKYYATRNNISLVLHFNGDPADPNDPQTVSRQLSNVVVHYTKTIDITPVILQALNNRQPRAATGGMTTRPTTPPRTGLPPRN